MSKAVPNLSHIERLTPTFNPPRLVVHSSIGLHLQCLHEETCGHVGIGTGSSMDLTDPALASDVSRKRDSSKLSLFGGELSYCRGAEKTDATRVVPARAIAVERRQWAPVAPAMADPGVVPVAPAAAPVITEPTAVDTRVTLRQLMAAAAVGSVSSSKPPVTKKVAACAPPAVTVQRPPESNGASSTPASVGRTAAASRDTLHAFSERTISSGACRSFVKSDFHRLGEVCRNIAASSVSIEHFCRKFGLGAAYRDSVTADVVVSILWQDLSTNHKVVCTDQVRSQALNREGNSVIGLLVLLNDEPQVVYLLPLAHCASDSDIEGGAAPLLPLHCGVTYAQRWVLAADILFERSPPIARQTPRLKVVYNIQLIMLALLSYCSGVENGPLQYAPGDLAGLLNCGSYEELLGSLLQTPGTGARAPHSFFPIDPKIVGFMCDDSNSNKETVPLELADLFSRFGTQSPMVIFDDRPDQGRVTRAIGEALGEMVALLDLGRVLHGRLRSSPLLYRYYSLVELPLLELLSSMEYNGIPVDRDYLGSCEEELKSAMETVTVYAKASVARSTGSSEHRFNIASPEQVSNILYNVLRVQAPASASGSGKAKKFISTAEEDLQRIVGAHPLVGYVLQYRALAKVVHTYIEGFFPYIVAKGSTAGSVTPGGIERFFGSSVSYPSPSVSAARRYTLHPQWNVTSVRTGRLSCSKPNLQSLPNAQMLTLQDQSGKIPDQTIDINLRRCVVTSSGTDAQSDRSGARSILISADYSQIEMRLLAHISNDQAMIQLFKAGVSGAGNDIYRQLAVAILGQGQGSGCGERLQFGVDPAASANVTDAQRSQAKVVTLGVMYGMGPQAAANKLNISVPAVKNITGQFFRQFSGVRDWMASVKRYRTVPLRSISIATCVASTVACSLPCLLGIYFFL